eukprot:CAMPEP_0118690860 /NCGR_PEP_ID=MMETSP0800-20121206/10352_1 /TAXON_ID=210618 ORGANISM="Striatella unipunctata, Strain CCMP2910" /NCGR_SAMPLE_ID=MMETSP0800 /ASSEMBLY_ACC=CAM_ASM_000638 /LENGTH=227 /DNA_ID=CAMNT_0006588561 /DNA_START=321 /DNA_END=1004 /DNA_ORIENTATION=+
MHKQEWQLPRPLADSSVYLRSVASMAAAMKACGMHTYSEELVYGGSSKPEMNDATREHVDPLSKRNEEIFLQFKENLKQGAFPPIQIVHDNEMGFAVEALCAMSRHTLICEYVGEVITEEESVSGSDSLMWLLSTGDPNTSLIIDPTRYGNIARFLSGINNQSLFSRRQVNIRTRRFTINGKCRVALFTSKKIERGERLVYDYNAGIKGKSAEEWATNGFYDTSNFF